MIVYHGTTEIIKTPDVFHSKKHLDFGMGCQEKILDNLFFIRYYSKGDKNG